jgi:hypothetical protein
MNELMTRTIAFKHNLSSQAEYDGTLEKRSVEVEDEQTRSVIQCNVLF